MSDESTMSNKIESIRLWESGVYSPEPDEEEEWVDLCVELADVIGALCSENERLIAALEPFAVSYQSNENLKAQQRGQPLPFPDAEWSFFLPTGSNQRAHEALMET